MALTRRAALRLSIVGVSAGLSGCVTRFGRGTIPQEPPLSLVATVLQQPSSESPARFEAELQNVGSRAWRIGMGPTLLFSDPGLSERPERAEEIVLDPETYIGPWDEPTQTTDGCCRFPASGTRAIQSSLEWIELEPDDPISETNHVYTRGESRPCRPAGTYQFQDYNYFESEDRPILLTLVLEISEENRLAAGRGTVEFAERADPDNAGP